jgi:hypothetical protein
LAREPEFRALELSWLLAPSWFPRPDRPKGGRSSESRSAGQPRSTRQVRAGAGSSAEGSTPRPASSLSATPRAAALHQAWALPARLPPPVVTAATPPDVRGPRRNREGSCYSWRRRMVRRQRRGRDGVRPAEVVLRVDWIVRHLADDAEVVQRVGEIWMVWAERLLLEGRRLAQEVLGGGVVAV